MSFEFKLFECIKGSYDSSTFRTFNAWRQTCRLQVTKLLAVGLRFIATQTAQMLCDGIIQGSPNYSPRAKCGSRSHFVNDENIICSRKICWFGGMYHILKQSHYVRQGFLTWGASTPRSCRNQFQGVLGKVTYVAVKGKRSMMHCTCLFFILIVTRF